MFLDFFELFYSRPRFYNADSNSLSSSHRSTMTRHQVLCSLCSRPRRWRLAIWRHEPLPLVTPSLDIVFLVEHELISSSLDTFSSSSTNWFPDIIRHHSTRFPRRAQTDFLMSSLDTFSSSSTNWFPDIIRHHSTRFPRRARTDFLMSSLDTFSSSSTNWFPDYIIRHHSTRFPRRARTSKQSQRAFLKAWLTRGHLASPAMSIFYLVLVPRWLPPPSPTSSSSPS